MRDVGVVVVTYNSRTEIGPCLDAALATGAEVVVVDNASEDGTVAEAARRGVRVLANPRNLGFAAAVNQGFAVLNTPYVLLLNPDAVILGGLDRLRGACQPPNAAAGGCLLDERGAPQIGFMARALPTPTALILEALVLNRVWPRNPVNRRYRGLDLSYYAQCAVEQPAGAFLMVRRAVWQELGGFDESFWPLWFEDVDFCRRMADAGHVLYYVPEAVAKHTGGHSIPRLSVQIRHFYWYRSLLHYSAKHFRAVPFRAVCAAVVVGSIVRAVAESLGGRGWKAFGDYGRVASLAARIFLFGWRG
ncbi:MAG: glycosyltransferase family 2 protein [Bryobacteraceae bacterium]|jgi:GT2 family glycosyltransferase